MLSTTLARLQQSSAIILRIRQKKGAIAYDFLKSFCDSPCIYFMAALDMAAWSR
jgi:hypothetical protein